MLTGTTDAATMENIRGRNVQSGPATSPESALASELFDQFVSAGTFKSVLSTYRQLCDLLRLKPTNVCSFYPRLKAKLHSWRAASLWAKLDKRASHKCYNRGKACPNIKVLLIGAGPCGLRAAIEAQLLGAKVVVVEKRDRFSRNNVLHLWPFVIHDLRNLGAKKFFGKFCAGSIDHISIRQLQLILLKVALLLGVEIHENVGFVSLLEPPEDQTQERIGWRARVDPSDHPVSQYEFDVLIGADGKRNTLLGFNRKEFRGKLAIAITANFINKHTLEEARVPEISGVAFIFNQKFFQDMREQTGIDLENIVYYKDDTHYFVMTAKKQSLLDRGVIINDYNDTARLLSAENVDREALMEYARDAADFATNYQLPSCDFAVNHYRQADVAMFDFTSMYAAENACRITERRGHKLLQGLVGDSLLEPFWPTGSGCARGFLSSFDSAWMIRSWASGKLTPLQVLAEREAIYRLLAQTTPENLSKDSNQYTLNPSSRYPNLNLHAVLPSQVRILYNTDGKMEDQLLDIPAEIPKKKRRRESIIHPDALLNWCQRQVALHETIKIENLTSSWKNGLALCAILHRYRPDLIDISSLKPEDAAKNNQLAFDICEKELGIPPVMTGQEMSDCEVPDKLSMVSYVAQIYETFRGEIPVVCHPKSSNDDRAISPNRQSIGTPLAILAKLSNKLQNKRKYSLEKELAKEKNESFKRGRHPPLIHKRRSKERDKGIALDLINKDVELTNFKMEISPVGPKESINSRVKNLEMKMRRDAGLRCHLIEEIDISKQSPSTRAEHTELNIKLIQEQLKKNGSDSKDKKPTGQKVGRLRKDEWNVKMLEEKICQQQKSLQKINESEKSKIQQDIFDNKLRLIEAKLQSGGALTLEEEARFKKFDSCLNKLNEHLTKGNLDAGERGHNQVAAMTEHMSTIWDKKEGCRKDPLPPPPVSSLALKSEPMLQVGGSEVCYFCNKRVYLMERLSAEGLFFHRSCFKCEYCNASLRLGNYSFDKDTVCGGKFYCRPHFRMQKPDPRAQEMIKRKEAFLSCAFDEQKEKIYKTVLANAEKALSPNKQPLTSPQLDSSVTDSPTTDLSIILQENNGSRTPQELKSPNLLIEPSNNFARDQTPERVEYENIILNYSEEELLTTELEEEELTQKNLGPSHELTTSEDEYSDFSTDSESDEEAYAEELERSLTADETRKLAEQWQKKYSAEQSLVDSCASSSSGDEVSDTEIGSEDGTSDDIDSDEEYSIEEDPKQHNEKNKRNKTKESKSDLMVEVPVIDLKGLKQLSEEESTSTESDISEELSASAKGSDSETTGSDPDSDSEPELHIPPPQIPTIVIEESPPQEIDPDQEWAENILESNEKTEIDIGNKVMNSVKNKQTFPSNVLTSEAQAVFSTDKIDGTHLAEGFLEKKVENAIDMAINSPIGPENDVSSVQISADGLLSDEIVKDGDAVISSSTTVVCVCDTKLNPLSDDIEKMKKDTVHQVETIKDNLSKCATSEKMYSECDVIEKNNLIGETERQEPISKGASFRIPSSLPLLNSGKLVQNVCMDPSPCTCDSSSVSSSGGWGLLKSEQSSEDSDFPLIGPENTPLSPEKDFLPNTDFNCVQNVHNFFNTNDLTEFEHTGTKETEKTSLEKSPSSPIENNIGGNLFEISDNSASDLKTAELKNDVSSIKVSSNSLCEVSMDITSADGLNNHNSHSKDNVSLDMEIEPEFYDNSKLSSCEVSIDPQSPNDMNTADLCSKNNFSSDMEIESEDDHYNPAFVTIRQKNESHHNNNFSWDSDKSISVMWFNEQDNIDDSIIDWSVKKSENLSNVSSDDNVLYETANEVCSENSQNIVEYNLNSTKKTPEEESNENIHNLTLNQIQDSFSDYSTPCAPKQISSPIEQILADVNAYDITKTKQNGDSHIFDKKNSCLDVFEKTNENSTLNLLSEMNHNNSSTQNNSLTNDNSRMVRILSKDISIDQTSPLDNQDVSIGNTSDKDSKYRGYSGSFAEKIRPKSALGDTIYLRSLDINLQKQQFPSLAKSNDKLDDVNAEDGYQIKKKLFHSTEKLQDHQPNLGKDDSIPGFYKKGFQRHISIPGDNPSSTNIVKQSVMLPSLTPPTTKKDHINTSNIVSVSFDCSLQKPELLNKNSVTLFRKTFADPISPYTYSQVKAAKENIFPVKMRPKCDMDLTKLQAKREKRKSVHENIQGLPFADEEKAVTPIDTPTTPGNTFNPLGTDIETAVPDSFPLENSSAQDKARKEARARARLKSDEELGLSPKNYRKKYQRQLSLSSIYYDELVGDEFYDHENEVLEDEIIDGTFHAKRVEISELHSEGSDTDQQSSNKVIEKMDFISTNTSEAVKIENIDTRSVIDLTFEDLKGTKVFTPKTEIKHLPALLTSTPNTKNSSDSPDIGFPETPPVQSKSQPNQLSENFNEEEKLKSNSKKSFFSKLNFGKGHISKDKSNKNKTKDVENVRACSLPSDLSVKAPLKQKTLSNLKITKLKEKTKEKQKQKHSLIDSAEIVDSVLTKNIPTTDFVEPRSILLNSEQAKIVPKYAVYRNPGSRLTAIPQHIPMQKTENGLAPKASEDSFSDTEDDTQKHKVQSSANDMEKDDKDLSEKEKKAQRVIQKVQRQQELKRLRTAQEIQRRLEELEVQQRDLEQQGVEVEKALRGERQDLQHGGESDLMQEWYKLVHSKNRLLREEQELLIRLKELELEDRHSRLQQEMRERMAQSASQKNSNQIGEEKKILTEMLKIVEERDELVAMLDQLRLKEVEEDKTLGSKISHASGKLSNDKS